MTRTEALIALNLSMDIGSVRLLRLLDVFGSPEEIVTASFGQLTEVAGLEEHIARKLTMLGSSRLEQELTCIARGGISVLTIYDDAYPRSLRYVSDMPIVLYIKGSLTEADVLAIAMVGCRSPSFYGIEQAERFASEFACRGITVVSGMARGIDTRSHEGALKAGGRTIAVIGSGLGNVYPPENRPLAERIACSGAVMSEFPMNADPARFNFPRRNRIISGLALGVLVVEAGRNSGSLITARYGLEQGRDIFAIPGKIDSPQSFGTNSLIRDGAWPVSCIEDILDALPFLQSCRPQAARDTATAGDPAASLSCLETALYNIISHHPVTIAALMEQTGLSIAPLSSMLLSLQMKRLVTQVSAGTYIRSSDAR
ncbi:MAG TPA: DNA-processing protein DprA [Candidatus Omnitrophota bacterium]|nr:DNA-processing protein DprA [Candidatus Omnitrophota bacterium]